VGKGDPTATDLLDDVVGGGFPEKGLGSSRLGLRWQLRQGHVDTAMSGPAPAAIAASRAARASRTAPRCPASIRSSTRQVVGIDATDPNSSWRSSRTAIPLIASAPSAIATARSANTLPGSCSGTPR